MNHKEQGEFMDEIHDNMIRDRKKFLANILLDRMREVNKVFEFDSMICDFDRTIEVDGYTFTYEELNAS